jgi:hypothetical protein
MLHEMPRKGKSLHRPKENTAYWIAIDSNEVIVMSFDEILKFILEKEYSSLSLGDDKRDALKLFYERNNPHYRSDWFLFFLMASSLIPTVTFLCILLFLTLVKIIIDFFQVIFLQFLEAITEKCPNVNPEKFAPFTLAGLFIGIIADVVNIII